MNKFEIFFNNFINNFLKLKEKDKNFRLEPIL